MNMEQITPHGQMVEVIHFVYPRNGVAPFDWRIACMPNMVEFHSTAYHTTYKRTDSPAAVTCPQCKATGEFKAEHDKQSKVGAASRNVR